MYIFFYKSIWIINKLEMIRINMELQDSFHCNFELIANASAAHRLIFLTDAPVITILLKLQVPRLSHVTNMAVE